MHWQIGGFCASERREAVKNTQWANLNLGIAYRTLTTSIGWMKDTVITAAVPAIPTWLSKLGGATAAVANGRVPVKLVRLMVL